MFVTPVINILLIVACSALGDGQNRTSSTVALEGGPVIAPSSEHMIKVNHTSSIHSEDKHMIKVNHTRESTTVPAFEVGQKNDNKTSVAKKDAILVKSNATSTTTRIPQKPTITFGEDDEEPPSSKNKLNDTAKHGISIEAVTEKKKTDYVVPIVAVILSVPIVAIVMSVLWKRGADWWQHRHYRRMDFLIEGMYNN